MTHLEIMKFRHACKIFDENKKVGKADFNAILQAGILAPSYMGLEHWDFLVVQNKALRERIREKSWDQQQITSCSHLVVILAKIKEFKAGGTYITEAINRRSFASEEKRTSALKFYQDAVSGIFKNDDEAIFHWSHAQYMFAALAMMNEAASRGIDSCPMEGFDRAALGEILNLKWNERRVALLVPFGYRVKPQPQKIRRSVDDVVKWIE